MTPRSGCLEVGDTVSIPVVRVPGGPSAIVLGALIVVLGLYQLVRGFSRSQMRLVTAAVSVLFVLGFLCWAGTGPVGKIDVEGMLTQSVVFAVPIILGSMAGVMCERTGVINIAIEGQMLIGAFAGALGASLASNLGIGLIAALVAGGLLGALLAVFSVKFLVNQVVLGVVLNLLALGLTGYLYQAFMASNSEKYNAGAGLTSHKIPGLSAIPIIGPVLFETNWIVYAMYVIIVVINIALFRTRWGLRTRAVGEHPRAAATVGIRVRWTRYRNVIIGGMIAGLGGAFLTIGSRDRAASSSRTRPACRPERATSPSPRSSSAAGARTGAVARRAAVRVRADQLQSAALRQASPLDQPGPAC